MGFGIVDYVVMAVYTLVIIGMGMYFMRGQDNTEEYFFGGRRFHWLPVAISLYASLFSAISFLAAPGEAYNNGMMYYLWTFFVVPGAILAIIIFVPFFHGLSLTTAYEYLERRFNLHIRLLASFLFLMLRSFYLGIVLFACGIALYPVTGWSIPVSILFIGAVATLYTTLGGMKSVVWTDVMQFFVLIGGLLLIVYLIRAEHPDGFTGIWMHARSHGHTFNQITDRSFYSFNPFVRLSLWAMIVYSIFYKLGAASADQIVIQRYLSTRKKSYASRSLLWGTLLSIPVQFLLFFTGLGLFYFYGVHPEKALPGMTGDHVLVHFISSELPAGVGGIIMAAILAAVMSTVDSVLNSLSACTVNDFYKRVFRSHASEKELLRVATAPINKMLTGIDHPVTG